MIVRRGNRRLLDVDTFDLGPTPVEGYPRSGYSGSLVVGRSGERFQPTKEHAAEQKRRQRAQVAA